MNAQQDLDALVAKFEKANNPIKWQQAVMDDLDKIRFALQAQNDELQDENDGLRLDVEELEQAISDLQEDNTILVQENARLRQELQLQAIDDDPGSEVDQKIQ